MNEKFYSEVLFLHSKWKKMGKIAAKSNKGRVKNCL